MKQETIQRLVNAYVAEKGKENLGNYVSSVLDVQKLLSQQWSECASALMAEQQRHVAEVKRLRDKQRDIQAKCPHHERTYHPDASGGNDSETLCDLCCAEL